MLGLHKEPLPPGPRGIPDLGSGRSPVVEDSPLPGKNLGDRGPRWVRHWKDRGDCGPPSRRNFSAASILESLFFRLLYRINNRAAKIRKKATEQTTTTAIMVEDRPLFLLFDGSVGLEGCTILTVVGEKTDESRPIVLPGAGFWRHPASRATRSGGGGSVRERAKEAGQVQVC